MKIGDCFAPRIRFNPSEFVRFFLTVQYLTRSCQPRINSHKFTNHEPNANLIH